MEVRLRLYNTSPTRAELRLTAPVRGTLLGMAVILGAATFGFGDPPILGIIITVLMLIAGLYDERWTFDADAHTVTYRFGTLPVAITRRYGFDQVSGFGTEVFCRGTSARPPDPNTDSGKRKPLFQTRYVSLFMYLDSGERLVLETVNTRRQTETEDAARTLSRLCGKPVVQH